MLNCPPSPRALAINQAKVAKVAKAQAASSSSSAAFGKISSPSGTYKQPRGRAPKDHVWDSSSGVWVHTETGSARSSIGKSHAVDFDWSHEDLDGDELMHKVMDGLKVLDDKISHVIGRQHQQIRAQYVGGAAGAAAEMEAAAIALTSASSSSTSTSGVQI